MQSQPGKQSQSDSELVALSLDGDKQAFGQLIDRYWEVVAILIYNRLKNHADADDVVQETFIKAYRKLDSLREPKKFGSWVYNIAVTTTIDWMRSEYRHSSIPLHEIREDHIPGQDAQKDDFPYQENIVRAVQSLPEKYQIVVTLRYFKGLSYQEIAEHLNEPAGTISNRLHRANKLLRDWIDIPLTENQGERD